MGLISIFRDLTPNVLSQATRRRVFFAMLAVGLLGPLQSIAAVVTGSTTEQVSVRETPNGAIIESLKPGTVVAVLKVAGDWVQVMYLPSGAKNIETGWIEVKYVRVGSSKAGSRADDCEIEYKTGAEVCVTVTDANLDCRKDFSGEYYRGCEVRVAYEVRTDYRGRSYLDVQVECDVEIRYTGREMYSSRSDSASDNESHSLYAHGSDSGSINVDFSFSSFNEVTRVNVESAVCKVESVNLW